MKHLNLMQLITTSVIPSSYICIIMLSVFNFKLQWYYFSKYKLEVIDNHLASHSHGWWLWTLVNNPVAQHLIPRMRWYISVFTLLWLILKIWGVSSGVIKLLQSWFSKSGHLIQIKGCLRNGGTWAEGDSRLLNLNLVQKIFVFVFK